MADEKPLEDIASKPSVYDTTLKDFIPGWSFYLWSKDPKKNEKPVASLAVCAGLEAIKFTAYALGAAGLYELINR